MNIGYRFIESKVLAIDILDKYLVAVIYVIVVYCGFVYIVY